MTSSEYAVVSRSIIIDNPAENVWISLNAFGGNEKFNPLVTSSKLDGYGVGSKRICYVSIDGGKNVSKTIEIHTTLNEESMTMEYKITNASNTPLEW
jgi:hypothetical protein